MVNPGLILTITFTLARLPLACYDRAPSFRIRREPRTPLTRWPQRVPVSDRARGEVSRTQEGTLCDTSDAVTSSRAWIAAW